MQKSPIIFDFFGVICSEIAPIWFHEKLPQEDPAMLHEKYLEAGDNGETPPETIFAKLGMLAHESSSDVAKEWHELIRLDEDLLTFIAELKVQGHKIGLCTNAWSSFIRPIIEARRFEELFDAIIVSSEIGITKPDPRIFEATAEALSVAPSQCVFIDDSPRNVEAAAHLGMRGIHYTSLHELQSTLNT